MNQNPKPLTILIVDDDPGMVQTMNYILTEKGYEVMTAKDGFEAVERVKEKAFDVVLTDIKMPGMNGVELLKEINRLSPETTTVMMTAYTLPDLVEEAKREGALAILPKPLDLDKVTALVEGFAEHKPILILDDDLEFCKTLQNVLNKKGYNTTFATEVGAAIDLILETGYEIIFLDMKLKEVTGLDALVAIRNVDSRAIVILMTAYRNEMRDLIEKSLEKSAYTCVYKPIDIDELIKMLKDIEKKKLQRILGEH
ncbi:MAG: response regulator [Desulfobulbaceae bacterium]|nr:response regulator [Desulfobulbaceae bacterium]